MKAVIPVAGLGSRFLPATKVVPKELLPLFDRPVIHHIVEELVSAGVTDIIFIVPPGGSLTPNYFARDEALEQMLRKKGKHDIADKVNLFADRVRVHSVIQLDPKGDGHAILQAEKIIGNDDFFAFFGDEILEGSPNAPEQLLAARTPESSCVLGVQEVALEDVHRFGIVAHDAEMYLQTLIEKPTPEEAPSRLALLGKNLCSPEIFEALHHATPGKDGELRLADAFLELQKTKKLRICPLQGTRFDVGQPQGLLEASVYFSKQ